MNRIVRGAVWIVGATGGTGTETCAPAAAGASASAAPAIITHPRMPISTCYPQNFLLIDVYQ